MYLYKCEASQRNAYKKNSPFAVRYTCSLPHFLDTYKVHICRLIVHFSYAQHSGQALQ
jgi:hypothetical protein